MSQCCKVLLVEDEVRVAALLEDYLSAVNIKILHVADGRYAVDTFCQHYFDLVLLDINLPSVSGIDVCRQLRQISTVPIIMLSALNSESDRLLGLALEADDYIGKPFSPREVVAKVQALLRRTRGEWQAMKKEFLKTSTISSPSILTLDEDSYQVLFKEQALSLTRAEFALLKALIVQPGRIYARGQLMNAMYGDFRVVSDRTIDSHIKKLRNKLRSLMPEMNVIESIYGVGYKYNSDIPVLQRGGMVN